MEHLGCSKGLEDFQNWDYGGKTNYPKLVDKEKSVKNIQEAF
jgi:hypothetical protein